MQKDALNNLYQKLEDYIPKAVLAKKNKARTWLYGYNEKYDVVVISRSGEIKDVININGLCIALPKPPKEIIKNSQKNHNQYWERKELPKELSRIQSICNRNYFIGKHFLGIGSCLRKNTYSRVFC